MQHNACFCLRQSASVCTLWPSLQRCHSHRVVSIAQSFLIKPVQRIPRYKLLLEELLKYTPSEPLAHPDHAALQDAVKQVLTASSEINEVLRETLRVAKVYALQNRCTTDSLVLPLLVWLPSRDMFMT